MSADAFEISGVVTLGDARGTLGSGNTQGPLLSCEISEILVAIFRKF